VKRPKIDKEKGPLTHKEILVVLSGLMTGLLLAALDQTIVSTALKNIVEEFDGLNHYTWVVTAYLLTSTASTPLYGKISDLYGRRPVFQFAIITFLIGSLLAGASQNMTQLIFTRALQGLGAGGLMAPVRKNLRSLWSPPGISICNHYIFNWFTTCRCLTKYDPTYFY